MFVIHVFVYTFVGRLKVKVVEQTHSFFHLFSVPYSWSLHPG